MSPLVRVVAALVRRGSEVLVQQRPPGHRRALLWEFPGGKVEPGEIDAEALRRECREELSIEVAVGELVAETRHAYEDLALDLVLYQAAIVEGEPQCLSAHAIRWVPVERLAGLAWCPADVPLVEEVVRRAPRSDRKAERL